MKIETFLEHHGLRENPFDAEEARHDPIFERMMESDAAHPDHPDFAKILGRIDQPSSSVVFGEKGCGKTAISLSIARRVALHNTQHPKNRALLVAYDDLNPVLDLFLQRCRKRTHRRFLSRLSPEQLLTTFRLEDHQDAILSLAVTQLVDAILRQSPTGKTPGMTLGSTPGLTPGSMMVLPEKPDKVVRKLPRRLRVDLAVLAALYDQPHSGPLLERWRKLKSKLRLGPWRTGSAYLWLGTVFSLAASGLLAAHLGFRGDLQWVLPLAAWFAVAAVLLWGLCGWQYVRVWSLARRVYRELLTVPRSPVDLRSILWEMRIGDWWNQPWPVDSPPPGTDPTNSPSSSAMGVPNPHDSRYQLTHKLLDVLRGLGYAGMIILVDRVDEPAVISGHPDRMKPVVWPMLTNKFLQQQGVGMKLLLPAELRHLLGREQPAFFQTARLDKQNLIDRLSWSGTTLYDLCTQRLNTCLGTNANGATPTAPGSTQPNNASTPTPITLVDLFEPDVTQQAIIEALEQMHQPRDAFKFLYSVLQEHCRSVPEDRPAYRVPRWVLESVRRQQSQRVQELSRGLSPA